MKTFSGEGEVLKGDQHVCDVKYRLRQDEPPDRPGTITGEVEVLNVPDGTLAHVLNTLTLAEGELILRLKDGQLFVPANLR